MSNAVSILNDLIETSKDGEKGFRTSAEDTVSGELKSVFAARAQDCAKAAADLQQTAACIPLNATNLQGKAR